MIHHLNFTEEPPTINNLSMIAIDAALEIDSVIKGYANSDYTTSSVSKLLEIVESSFDDTQHGFKQLADASVFLLFNQAVNTASENRISKLDEFLSETKKFKLVLEDFVQHSQSDSNRLEFARDLCININRVSVSEAYVAAEQEFKHSIPSLPALCKTAL